MVSSKAQPKYRPVLTAEEIARLLALTKAATILDAISYNIIHKLSVLQTKIDNLAIMPAYTTSPKKSLMEQLGEVEPNTFTADNATKEQLWKKCYNKYIVSPTDCNLVEIQGAKEHMYLKGMMSDTEAKAFEQGEGL